MRQKMGSNSSAEFGSAFFVIIKISGTSLIGAIFEKRSSNHLTLRQYLSLVYIL